MSIQQPPPLPPPPPPPLIAVAPIQQELKKPYITLTELETVVDSSIERHVDELKDSVALTEVPVVGPSGISKKSIPKFNLVDGEYPKLRVKIYEQMVYHRAKSVNNNLLEIFVPCRYKFSYDKIKQYFDEKASDKETQELMIMVINAYNKNYNSLFYKHTIAGKQPSNLSSGVKPATDTSLIELDTKASIIIQNKIDKWHFDFAEWSFYDNARTFFVNKQKLPEDVLLTLKMDFDDVFQGGGGGGGTVGLINIVDEISGKYQQLMNTYTQNLGSADIITASDNFDNYITLFEMLYADIVKRKDESLDYINERQRYFPTYEFNAEIMNELFQSFDKIHNLFVKENLIRKGNAPAPAADGFGAVPMKSKIKLLQTINDEYAKLKKGIESNQILKHSVDEFDIFMLGARSFDIDRQRKFIPNYKIIQYIFHLIHNDRLNVAGDDLSFIQDAFTMNYNEINPDELYDLIQGLSTQQGVVLNQEDQEKIDNIFNEDEELIDTLKRLIIILNARATITTIQHQPNWHKNFIRLTPSHPPALRAWPAVDVTKQKSLMTQIIQYMIFHLDKNLRILPIVTANNGTEASCTERIRDVEEKIHELHGKHFRSMLIFYNYIKAKNTPPVPQSNIAIFFNKFYEESKLSNENLEPFSSIRDKTVEKFSFGVDLILFTLFRITKYYFSGMHANFIKKINEKIGPQNADIRNLTLEIELKDSKLKHICDIIAKTGEIPVERIIPDRASYYIKDPKQSNDGFVNPGLYKAKWVEKISKKIPPNPLGTGASTDGIADKVMVTTNKMKKKLDESLGITTTNVGTNDQKLAAMLSKLIELNTVQVINLMFAKPRNIWYSPDLRIRLDPITSKWIFFQLGIPEIISGRAFKAFKQELIKPVDNDGTVVAAGMGTSRILRILDKKSTTKVPMIKFSALTNPTPPPFLIFIISKDPAPPRMLDKDNIKDATDIMFDKRSFGADGIFATGDAGAGGVDADSSSSSLNSVNVVKNDGTTLASSVMEKIKSKFPTITPTDENCDSVLGQISKASADLNESLTKSLKSIGLDIEDKFDKFNQDDPGAAAKAAAAAQQQQQQAAALLAQQQAAAAAAAAAQQQAAAAAAALAQQQAAAAALAQQQAAAAAAAAAAVLVLQQSAAAEIAQATAAIQRETQASQNYQQRIQYTNGIIPTFNTLTQIQQQQQEVADHSLVIQLVSADVTTADTELVNAQDALQLPGITPQELQQLQGLADQLDVLYIQLKYQEIYLKFQEICLIFRQSPNPQSKLSELGTLSTGATVLIQRAQNRTPPLVSQIADIDRLIGDIVHEIRHQQAQTAADAAAQQAINDAISAYDIGVAAIGGAATDYGTFLNNVNPSTLQQIKDNIAVELAAADAAQQTVITAAATARAAGASQVRIDQLDEFVYDLEYIKIYLRYRDVDIAYSEAARNQEPLNVIVPQITDLLREIDVVISNTHSQNCVVLRDTIAMHQQLAIAALAAQRQAAAVSAAAAAAVVVLDQVQLGFLNRIFDECVVPTFECFLLRQLQEPPRLRRDTAVTRDHIIQCLSGLTDELSNRGPDIAAGLLDNAGIPGDIEGKQDSFKAYLETLDELLNNPVKCDSPGFDDKVRGLRGEIANKEQELEGEFEKIKTEHIESISVTVIPSFIAIQNKYFTDPKRTLTQTDLDDIHSFFQREIIEIFDVQGIHERIRLNYLNMNYKIQDIERKCTELELEYAKCIDDQSAKLDKANLYLERLKTHCTALLPQSGLPPGFTAQAATTIAHANAQIGGCLDALVDHLPVFKGEIIPRDVNEEIGRRTQDILSETRDKIKTRLSADVVGECKDTGITSKIDADTVALIGRTTQSLNPAVSARFLSDQSLVQTIDKAITDLESDLNKQKEGLNQLPLTFEYDQRGIPDITEMLGNIRSSVLVKIAEKFQTDTLLPINQEVDTFIENALAEIRVCVDAQKTAAQLAADATQNLRDYLTALNGVLAGLPNPPPPTVSSETIATAIDVQLRDQITKGLGSLLQHYNENAAKIAVDINGITKVLQAEIDKTNAEIKRLQKLLARLDDCDDQEIVDQNKKLLEDIIKMMGLSLEITQKAKDQYETHTRQLNEKIVSIRKLIEKEQSDASQPLPVRLKPVSIQTFEPEYSSLLKGKDALLVNVRQTKEDSQKALERNRTGIQGIHRQLQACIDKRKSRAEKMLQEASDLAANVQEGQTKCQTGITAINTFIGLVTGTGGTGGSLLVQISDSNPQKAGFRTQIFELKTKCDALRLHLSGIGAVNKPIDSLLEDVRTYRSSLAAGDGPATLQVNREKADDSFEELSKQKTAIDGVLLELAKCKEQMRDLQNAIETTLEAEVQQAKNAALEQEQQKLRDEIKRVEEMEKSSLANIQSITTQLDSYDGSDKSLEKKQTELRTKIDELEVRAGLSERLNELSGKRANNRGKYMAYRVTHDPSSLAREKQKITEYKTSLDNILRDSTSADDIERKLKNIASIKRSFEEGDANIKKKVGDIATLISEISEIDRETTELENQLAAAKAAEAVLKNKEAEELLRKQIEDADAARADHQRKLDEQQKEQQKATLATLREKFKGIIGAVVEPTTGNIDIKSKDNPKVAWIHDAVGASDAVDIDDTDGPDSTSTPVKPETLTQSAKLLPSVLPPQASTAALTAPAAHKTEEEKQLSKVQDILKRLLSLSEMDTFTKLYPGQTGDVRFMDALVAIITHYSGSLLVDKDETYKELMANNYDYLKILERNQKINFLLNKLDKYTSVDGSSMVFDTNGKLSQSVPIQKLISSATKLINESRSIEEAAKSFIVENYPIYYPGNTPLTLKQVTISAKSTVLPLLKDGVNEKLKSILVSDRPVPEASRQILSSRHPPERDAEYKRTALETQPMPPAPATAPKLSPLSKYRPVSAKPNQVAPLLVSTTGIVRPATARPWRSSGGGTRRRNKIFRQKGGDATIIITPESSIYKKVVLGSLDQEGPDLEQTRDELLERELNNGSIRVYENNGPDVESSTTPLALAKSAVNSQVAMEHLMNSVDEHFKVKPGSADKTTLQRYKTLVRLCSASTAVQLIKELLKQNNTTTSLNDKQILTILGWNNSENLLFYNPNKNSNGGALLGALFSLFSYSQGKFSYFLSQNCAKDYVCMLNWILLIAEHLNYEQDHSYTYENIRELVKNMYDCLFGFLERDRATLLPYFVNNTNVNFYKELVIKGLLGDKIFGDQTLKPIVDGIKNELQKMGGSPQQQQPPLPTTPRPLQRARKTTVRLLGGDERKKNKTRKHHNKKNNKSDHNTIKRHTRRRNLIKTAQPVSVSGSV
jgi:hypothetical protein